MANALLTPAAPQPMRSQSWLRRFRVRIACGCLLILLLSIAGWWVPRRGSVYLRRNGGNVHCDADTERANYFLSRLDNYGWGSRFRTCFPPFKDVYTAAQSLSKGRRDEELNRVSLTESSLTTEGLFAMSRMTNLKYLAVHDRQMGHGLDVFHDFPDLKEMGIWNASTSRLRYLRMPHLESLDLWNPQADGGESSESHVLPQLKGLFLADCTDPAAVLQSLPKLPTVEILVFQDAGAMSGRDFRHFQRFPALKDLRLAGLPGCVIDEHALEALSQLTQLERFLTWQPWEMTDAGLERLAAMKSLKTVYAYHCTPNQFDRLKKALPHCDVINSNLHAPEESEQ